MYVQVGDLDALRKRAQRARAARIRLARDDANTFISLVMRDEKTGLPVRQAPVHEAWHEQASLHDRLVIWSHPDAGKSTQLSMGRVLWELGRNPNLRVAILSRTHDQARKIVRTIARHIEASVELQQVFPRLKRDFPWTDTRITVERQHIVKTPSVQAFGVHGAIMGDRVDLFVIDDVLDKDNTKTLKARNDLWDWYQEKIVGRGAANHRVLCVGNAFHPGTASDGGDLLHRLAKQPGFVALRYPVVDDQGNPRWPEHWPLERVALARRELTALEFSRQMLCVARSDQASVFKSGSVDACRRRGEGMRLAWALERVPAGCRTFTGVDIGIKRDANSDLTALFHLIVYPNGDRRVLDVEAGRWHGDGIIARAIDAHRRYHSIVFVENNAAQDFIVQGIRSASAVPVRPFTTGRNKTHPLFGLESLAGEIDNEKWIIPSSGAAGTHPEEVDAWVSEMLYYSPGTHTGDRLMASWIAREGARSGAAQRAEFGTNNFLGR